MLHCIRSENPKEKLQNIKRSLKVRLIYGFPVMKAVMVLVLQYEKVVVEELERQIKVLIH